MIWALWASLALGDPWGPWQGAWPPVEGVDARPAPPPARAGFFERAYRFYRRYSDKNGGGCPYYPTCSAYGILAVRDHGPFVGALIASDRLMREYPWMDHAHHYPLVTPHGVPRLYDPVPERLLGEP